MMGDDARDDVRRVPADVERHRDIYNFSISSRRHADDYRIVRR